MAGDKGQPSPASSRASKSGVRPIPGTATTQVAKAEAWASPARHALQRLAWSRRMSARLWRTSRKRRHTHERTSSNTHTGTRARSHSHAPPCPCSLSLEQPCPLGGLDNLLEAQLPWPLLQANPRLLPHLPGSSSVLS